MCPFFLCHIYYSIRNSSTKITIRFEVTSNLKDTIRTSLHYTIMLFSLIYFIELRLLVHYYTPHVRLQKTKLETLPVLNIDDYSLIVVYLQTDGLNTFSLIHNFWVRIAEPTGSAGISSEFCEPLIIFFLVRHLPSHLVNQRCDLSKEPPLLCLSA